MNVGGTGGYDRFRSRDSKITYLSHAYANRASGARQGLRLFAGGACHKEKTQVPGVRRPRPTRHGRHPPGDRQRPGTYPNSRWGVGPPRVHEPHSSAAAGI